MSKCRGNDPTSDVEKPDCRSLTVVKLEDVVKKKNVKNSGSATSKKNK